MKGLKSKVLIAVIMILSIVLGYQASVRAANGCGEVFYRPGTSVPFKSKGHLILCREHTNGWKNCRSFICRSEYKINKTNKGADGKWEKEEGAAHGMAYFLHNASKYGINYGNEIQSWIWNHSSGYNGGSILYSGSSYPSYFSGDDVDITQIENFLKTDFKDSLDEITAIEQENKSLKDAIESKTASVVDSYPNEFFTKVSGEDIAEENDTRIKEISAEEYNYLYQLVYVFDFIDKHQNLSKEDLKEELEKHINKYQAEMGMTIYKGSIPADTKNSEVPAVSSSITTDFYGSAIKLTKIDYDGNGEPNAVMWQYVDENNNVVDENVYFADDSYGTKFSNRVLLTEDKESKDDTYYTMLSNYINLYDGTYTVDRLIEALRNYSEKQDENVSITFKDLATKLEKTCKGKKGKELYDSLYGLLVGYKENIDRIAENTMTQEEVPSAEMTNPLKNNYVFKGTTEQVAKIYQKLVDEDIFDKCVDRFEIDEDAAKVSVDRVNMEYIVGPFSTNYFTITLNNKNLLRIKEFDVLLQLDNEEIVLTKNKNNQNVFIIRGETVAFKSETPYDLITSDDSDMPKSGEKFYIQLSQEALTEIIKKLNEKNAGTSKENREEFYLLNTDRLGAKATYTYLECISATIHFLQGNNGSDSVNTEGTFNRIHPQRLMTFDTEEIWNDKSSYAYVAPESYNFEIRKVDQNNNMLQGAEFAIYGRYTATEGDKEIYVDALDGKVHEFEKGKGYDSATETFAVLNNVTDGKFIVGKNGNLLISIDGTITYNNETFQLESIVAKETKAPEGCTLDDKHIKIDKIDGGTETHTHTNIVSKPYKLKVRKVDENGDPISGVKLRYWFVNLEEGITSAENTENSSNKKTVITDKNGEALLTCNNHSKLVGLIIQEVKDKSLDPYKYFESMMIIYSPKIDSEGNVSIEYYDTNDKDEGLDNIFKSSEYTPVQKDKDGNDIDFVNGVYRIITKDNSNELYGKDANKYIKCGNEASNGIDIQITNEKIEKYNLELLKFDENGNRSTYLDGTKFIVNINKTIDHGSEQSTLGIEKEIDVIDGKAIMENVGMYGDNINVYIEEIPNVGFKTSLTESKKVMTYKADEDGNVEILSKNEKLLNPAGISKDGYEPAGFDDKTMTLKLGIINQPEEYSLKFRKTDPQGTPLQGATFTLAGNCEKDENGNNVYTDIIGTDTSEEVTGDMTYKGLTKTGNVTLYLYEESAPKGYLSIATKENPLVITYKYEPGSNKLDNFSITHNDEKIFYERELGLSTDEKTGDLGTLNHIFDLENTEAAYDLELFTKVDKKDEKPIGDMKFNITMYSKDEMGQKVYAEYETADGKVEKIVNKQVESRKQDGKVILEKVKTYGKLYVEINEKSDSNGNYETLLDTLIFNYTIAPGAEAVWGEELEVLGEQDVSVTYYLKGTNFVDESGNIYPYADKDGIKGIRVKNEDKPYNLVIKKVNSVDGTAIPNVQFTAVVFKNGTSERKEFEGVTNENGEIVLEGITIYNNVDDDRYKDRLSISITETVPEGYKWHEHEKITYSIDYLKYSSNGDIELLTDGSVRVAWNPEKSDSQKLLATNAFTISEEANSKSHDVVIPNTPVYDLDLFDMKAIATNSQLQEIIGKQEIDFSDVVANSGIEFTAEVKDANNNLVQSDVKVTFDENGIVAHDIDTSSLFTNNIKEVKGLKLVLTETQTNGLVEIDPITIVYDCKYVDGKFEPTKTGYEYQDKLYELKDFANKNVEIVDGLIYIDKEGNHVLVNTPKTAQLVLKKYDEDGKAINGVRFQGRITSTNGVHNFDVTTGETGIDGEAVISNISLTGEVTLVITDEYWKDGKMPEGMNYSELEFIKDDITISGIMINQDAQGNKSVDCSNAKVDDAHKEQVKINEATMAIEVTNKNLTYNIPMVKTTETDEPLNGVVFDFIIKEGNVSDDNEANKFFEGLETKDIGEDKGRIDLNNIDKFGEDLVLVIEERTSDHSDYKMLDGKVYVNYSAIPNYETNKVDITIKDIQYEDGTDASEEVEVLSDENGKFIGIKVINHHEYSITLRKVMNVNGSSSEANEKVTFKGFVTTDAELVDEVGKMTYDEFKDYINQKDSTDDTEKTLYFKQETKIVDGKNIAKIDKLNEYKDRVYVYFIEELQPNSSMTLVEEVLKVSFIKEVEDSVRIGENQESILSCDEDNLDIEITVENDASAYKLNFLKVDSKGNPVDSLAKAKFKFTLKELKGAATQTADTAIIKLDDDGQIDYKNSSKGEKYIIDFRLTDDGYIQLDINKFGEDLQLEIEEEEAPEHYITNDDTFVIPYTAEPGKITIGNNVSDGLTVKADAIGIEVKLPNDELPYDLPVYKVLKENVNDKNEEGKEANNITFDVNFFDVKNTPIMGELSGKYTTELGEFTVKGIKEYGEYYMTLEETHADKNVIKIPGIHVFKIKAEARDTEDNKGNVNKEAVKSIEYLGTGTFDANGKLKIEGNKDYDKYFETSKTDSATGETIPRLEISNKKTVPYSLDLFKYCETTNNPLNGVTFDAYLTKPEEHYQDAENLLGVNNSRDTKDGGKISFTELDKYGKYKLTLIETHWPVEVKQTFDRIEVIYSTEDGKAINVESAKVFFGEKEVSNSSDIVKCTPEDTSLKIGIKNIKEKPVPLKIYKVKYEEYRDEQGNVIKKEVPIEGAEFSGTVTAEGEEPQTFNNKISDKYGIVDLGDFYINGEVTVDISEIVAPAGVGTIPDTEIYINVTNETQKVDSNNWSQSSNAVESIEKNTFKIIDPEAFKPCITLSGMVWEEVKQSTKGPDSYQDTTDNKTGLDGKIDFTEGLYDEGYDKPMENVKVLLHRKEDGIAIKGTKTNAAGQYVFKDLNPFEQYYITFEYYGDKYESVKYLVQDLNGTEYTGELKDALETAIRKNIDGERDTDIWARNSKAVTNEYQSNIATTTNSNQARKNADDTTGAIQYYPVQSMFTIADDKVELYYKKSEDKYFTKGVEDAYKENGKFKSKELEAEFNNTFTVVTYSPLNPSHQQINLGLIPKAKFNLNLVKDVEAIEVALGTGANMKWEYGKKPDSGMYQLKLSQADIENISELNIVYKIEVTNIGEIAGKLNTVTDYYNSDLLDFVGAYYKKVKVNENTKYDKTKVTASSTASRNAAHNIIPIQEGYNKNQEIIKKGYAATECVDIMIADKQAEIAVGEKFVIYIKYKYIKDNIPLKTESGKAKDVGYSYVTLGVAEIFSSIGNNGSRDDNSNAPSLMQRAQSGMDNFYENINKDAYYTKLSNPEDDEDTAPAMKMIVGEAGKTVSGIVFEDTNGDNKLTGKMEENEFKPDDAVIKGVKVTLFNKTGDKATKVQEVYTAKDGSYSFKGVPAGEYYMTFTYGDENTVLPILESKDENGKTTWVTTSEMIKVDNKDVTFNRNNKKSYNTLEFEGLVPASNTGLFWYTSKERQSDAEDIKEQRQKANAEITTDAINPDSGRGIMNNELAEKMNSYSANLDKYSKAKEYISKLAENSVTAKTPNFQLNIENTTANEVYYAGETETGKTLYASKDIVTPTNIDFGIKGREQSKLTVTKQVDKIKITKSDGVVTVEAKYDEKTGKIIGTASKVKWNKPVNGDEEGIAWIQRDETEIIGAEVEITYKITVKNEAGEEIYVTVADYIQDGMTYDKNKNKDNGWSLAKAETKDKQSTLTVIKEDGSLDSGSTVKINNKIDLTAVTTVATQDIKLDKENNFTNSKYITLTTNLSNFNDTPVNGYTNYVEVIQTITENGFARKDAYSIPGNYDPVNNTTTEGNIGIVTNVDKSGLEKDTAKSIETVSITPETGENRATYYILAISIITVFAVGIILIKKKVLDR